MGDTPIGDQVANQQSEPSSDTSPVEELPPVVKPLDFDPQATVTGFPGNFTGYKPVVEGVREITQNPKFDPEIDSEEDFE